MALKITPELLQFLDELHEWIAAGKPAYEFAALKGLSSGTITYRLNFFGLAAKRAEGLVCKLTGTPYPELKEGDRFELSPSTDPTPAAA